MNCIGDELLEVDADNVRDIVANMPLEIVDEFRPQTMQVVVPVPLLQEIDLLAAVPTGPMVEVAAVKSEGE